MKHFCQDLIEMHLHFQRGTLVEIFHNRLEFQHVQLIFLLAKEAPTPTLSHGTSCFMQPQHQCSVHQT